MPRISVLSWIKAPSLPLPSLRNTYSSDTPVSRNAQQEITLMLAKTHHAPKAAIRGSLWQLLKKETKLIPLCKLRMPRLRRDFLSFLPYPARSLREIVILTSKPLLRVMLNWITIRMLLRYSKTVKHRERESNSTISLLMGLSLINHTYKTGKDQHLLIQAGRIRVLISHLTQSNRLQTLQ